MIAIRQERYRAFFMKNKIKKGNRCSFRFHRADGFAVVLSFCSMTKSEQFYYLGGVLSSDEIVKKYAIVRSRPPDKDII